MNILLLGGTGFLGRAIARMAIERHHDISCLARGNGEVTRGATFVQANRDNEGRSLPWRLKNGTPLLISLAIPFTLVVLPGT